jgi:hypothetical protein
MVVTCMKCLVWLLHLLPAHNFLTHHGLIIHYIPCKHLLREIKEETIPANDKILDFF